MKNGKLFRAIGDIDPRYVEEAARGKAVPFLRRKAVWMPLVAAAACVALTVGLWQGGVFDPAEIPVEAPNEGATTTTVNTTVPADTTVDTTTTTTAKPTTTQAAVLITADEPDRSDMREVTDADMKWPSKGNACTPLLKEKMEQYRGTNATFAVIVTPAISYAKYEEFEKRTRECNKLLLELANEKWKVYQDYVESWIVHPDHIELDESPYPEKEAGYYALRDLYLKLLKKEYGDVEDIEDELLRERIKRELIWEEYYAAHVRQHTLRTTKDATEEEKKAAADLRDALEEKAVAASRNYNKMVEQARAEYHASVIAEHYQALVDQCETPPKDISTEYVKRYYAELTADQIDALAERKGYWFRLSMPDGIDNSRIIDSEGNAIPIDD